MEAYRKGAVGHNIVMLLLILIWHELWLFNLVTKNSLRVNAAKMIPTLWKTTAGSKGRLYKNEDIYVLK